MSTNTFQITLVNPNSVEPVLGAGTLTLDTNSNQLTLNFTPVLGKKFLDETSYVMKQITVPIDGNQVTIQVYSVKQSTHINSMSFVVEQADIDNAGNVNLLNGCAQLTNGSNTYQGSLIGGSGA